MGKRGGFRTEFSDKRSQLLLRLRLFHRTSIAQSTPGRRIWETREFSPRHGSDALYQGTTLVGPHRSNKNPGFSPWAFFAHRILSGQIFGQDTPWQGLKPNSLFIFYGPTKVVP